MGNGAIIGRLSGYILSMAEIPAPSRYSRAAEQGQTWLLPWLPRPKLKIKFPLKVVGSNLPTHTLRSIYGSGDIKLYDIANYGDYGYQQLAAHKSDSYTHCKESPWGMTRDSTYAIF